MSVEVSDPGCTMVPEERTTIEVQEEGDMAIRFPEPIVLDADAALDLIEKVASRHLGCSAQEFLARWDMGEFRGQDTAVIAELSSLIPFVR